MHQTKDQTTPEILNENPSNKLDISPKLTIESLKKKISDKSFYEEISSDKEKMLQYFN